MSSLIDLVWMMVLLVFGGVAFVGGASACLRFGHWLVMRAMGRAQPLALTAAEVETRLAETLVQLERTRSDLEQCRAKGLQAVRERDSWRARAEAADGGSGDPGEAEPSRTRDTRFRRAKTEFARLYHPDNLRGDPRDRARREELFKEFWSVLERIEKGGRG